MAMSKSIGFCPSISFRSSEKMSDSVGMNENKSKLDLEFFITSVTDYLVSRFTRLN